ncbi:MAG: NPCBM/NEW2 domain-containing protein [Planctomycetaceae bacterium]
MTLRPLIWGLSIWVPCLAFTSVAAADVIRKFDEKEVTGSIMEANDNQVVIVTGTGPEELSTPVSYRDINSIHFCGKEWDPKFSRLLVDNRGEKYSENSGAIKLRAGQHPIGIVYWSTKRSGSLRVELAGPGMERGKLPSQLLFHVPGAAPTQQSTGFDADGFLTPVTYAPPPQPGLFTRVVEWASGDEPKSYCELKGAMSKESLASTVIGTKAFKHADSNYGVYYSGLIQIPKDGEYTFSISSEGKSLLWIGREPESVQPFNVNIKADSVHVMGVNGGRWYGKLVQLSADKLITEVPLGGALTTIDAPLDMIQEAWRGSVIVKEIRGVDRTGESTTLDSVYVLKESPPATPTDGKQPSAPAASTTIQRVNGKVLGITGDSLQMDYMGETRGIKMERVIGVVFKGRPPSLPQAPGVITLSGGITIPGQLTKVEPGTKVHFKSSWGQEFSWPYSNVVRMTVRNGRTTPLTDQQPVSVEETPYFDRHFPWTTDKSLTGPPLMIGEKRYTRGVCLHSRTVLTYALNGEYSGFQCDVGLQGESGKDGNAAVRVLADGVPAYENPSLTAASGVQSVSINVTGKKTLTLEVDYGEKFDVCDHVTFGDPRLLRESQ